MRGQTKIKRKMPNAGFSNETALRIICVLYPIGVLAWVSWFASTYKVLTPVGSLNPSTGQNSPNGTANANSGSQKQAAAPGSNGYSSWPACAIDVNQNAPPPQPGETWWPVVGPVDSLQDARQYCRGDAYINRSGNVQVASFRDRSVALEFASAISANSNGRYRFWLGEPSYR